MPDVGEMPRGRPEVTGEHGLTEAFGAAGVGAWVWYTAAGRVSLDDRAMGLLGVDPDTYDGHIKTWLTLMHPDDIAWATAEVGKALRTFGPYEVEYRICCPDGAARWVQVRGHVEPEVTGSRTGCWARSGTAPSPMSPGTGCGCVALHERRVPVGRQDWRITFANVQAELLLGAGQRLAGQELWDLPVSQVPGLEACCREAVNGMRPAGL